MKKGFQKSLAELKPDILCLQETKAQSEEVKTITDLLKDYKHSYVNSSKERKGYSGTAIISKTEPINVIYDMGISKHDQEGRVITAEYENFYLVTVYVPNSGRGLPRLPYRQGWDVDFGKFLRNLDKKKPVIACGDFNVAHTAEDLANPKSNYNKTAGYTQEEIDGFTNLLGEEFVDSFRHLYPEKIAYSYWSYMFNARANNKGWRIDYFLVSDRIKTGIKETDMFKDLEGSDHCPVSLEIEI